MSWFTYLAHCNGSVFDAKKAERRMWHFGLGFRRLAFDWSLFFPISFPFQRTKLKWCLHWIHSVLQWARIRRRRQWPLIRRPVPNIKSDLLNACAVQQGERALDAQLRPLRTREWKPNPFDAFNLLWTSFVFSESVSTWYSAVKRNGDSRNSLAHSLHKCWLCHWIDCDRKLLRRHDRPNSLFICFVNDDFGRFNSLPFTKANLSSNYSRRLSQGYKRSLKKILEGTNADCVRLIRVSCEMIFHWPEIVSFHSGLSFNSHSRLVFF